ncbi:MAG: protein-L-isoaspartate O-methyltransferase, partial [Woeseia sp.]
QGLPEGEFDVIVITGSLPRLDQDWLKNLKADGRLFVVTGEAPIMEAQLVTRGESEEWTRHSLFETCLPRLQHVKEPSSFSF